MRYSNRFYQIYKGFKLKIQIVQLFKKYELIENEAAAREICRAEDSFFLWESPGQ